MLKKNLLISLFAVLLLPAVAQQTDTLYTFRFVPQKNDFYAAYKGNGPELERLLDSIRAYSREIAAGQMYLAVSSYAPVSTAEVSSARMGYLQSSRVKSELILRGGITERNFVTDRMFKHPFRDTLHHVVVVTFPAGVETVKRIAGDEAAEKVEAYVAERIASSPEARRAAEAERQATLRADQERKARQEEAERQAQQQARQTEAERKAAETERQRLAAEALARRQAEAAASPYTFALCANLLRWATLTPDLGVEWRINRDWGIQVNGAWTSWSWDDKNRRYALWNVSPEVHYYIGKEKRGYVGAMYHTGEFNYKLGVTGKQGDSQGGGITGGYQLPIGKSLAINFSLGLGYTRADFEKYTVVDGVRVRQGSEVKNYWGVNQAGVSLVWKLF